MNLTTSLTLLREHRACADRYRHLRRALGPGWGKEKPIPILRVLRENGLADALWALRAVPEKQAATRDKIAHLLAADYAAHVLHVFESRFPTDTRPRDCIVAARLFARGKVTRRELAVAGAAAEDAAWEAKSVFAPHTETPASMAAAAAMSTVWGCYALNGDMTVTFYASAGVEREWQAARFVKYLRSSTLPRPIPLPRRPKIEKGDAK